MSVYMIIEVKVKDKDTYAKYVERVRPIVEKYRGRYLARGGKVVPLTGNWDAERIVVIEFPSFKEVKLWFTSAEYNAVAPLREASAITKAVVIEGCRNE